MAVGVGIWFLAARDATPPISVAPPADIPHRPDDAIPLTVVTVWDGDTLRARAVERTDLVTTTEEIRIRLIGIDTPERDPDECWAQEARDRLLELAPPGSTVWASPDQDPLDRYDRWLFYLWSDDGRFINHTLAAEGDAQPLRVPPNITYDALFIAAADDARAAGRGRWSACG